MLRLEKLDIVLEIVSRIGVEFLVWLTRLIKGMAGGKNLGHSTIVDCIHGLSAE